MWCDENVGKGLEDLKVAVPRMQNTLMQLHLTQVCKEQGSCNSALQCSGLARIEFCQTQDRVCTVLLVSITLGHITRPETKKRRMGATLNIKI